MAVPESNYDVLVIGSGAAGMIAALRAHDSGAKVAIMEKSKKYGGTSALSGGQFWIPSNPLMRKTDDVAQAREYLRTITEGEIDERKLDAFLGAGPEMVRYLLDIGIALEPMSDVPDYFSHLPGGIGGRSLCAKHFDAAALGDEFRLLREPPSLWRIFNRYVMDTPELGILGMRLPGWRRTAARLVLRYWLDIPWRLKTHRDRRLTMGNALVARLRHALAERGVPIFLNHRLTHLVHDSRGVHGGIFARDLSEVVVGARRGVILAAGGYEHNQAMRDAYLPVPTTTFASMAPGTNTGDGLRVGLELGAATEFLQHGWWVPTTQQQTGRFPNNDSPQVVARLPHSICVNARGKRFTNEAMSYDRFGHAMIADWNDSAVDSTIFCWLIFDAQYRRKYLCGSILPSIITPDRAISDTWWDNYIYRSDTVAGLAKKISVNAPSLSEEISRINRFASTGVDTDFGRGEALYDRAVNGDPRIRPNPALGTIAEPPYYAVRVDLGDLGTKGGLLTDEHGRVMTGGKQPILGLYAIGNSSGALFAGAYPGPGGTLGPAMTFAFIVANHLAGCNTASGETAAQIPA